MTFRTVLYLLLLAVCSRARAELFEIQVVDQETSRGVPLVEIETVDHVKFVTDSAGRVALDEPAFNHQSVFFYVRSHGYEFPKDGFGMQGTRLKVVPGGREVIKMKRLNVAERLYRITGEGIYRDSSLLGYPSPIDHPLLNGQVLGQDSIQRVIYRGAIHWFWGDTLRLSYPLGNFRMSGAISHLPEAGGLLPEIGINLTYFTNADGFCQGMFPIEPKGDLIWADGFMVLPNERGQEQMVAHYLRLKGLGKPLARGLAIYNDERNEFEKLADLDLHELWRFPHGHPISLTNSGQHYFYFGGAFPNVRVPASLDAIRNTNAYEAFSCLKEGSDGGSLELETDDVGHPRYRWTRHAPPITSKQEEELIKTGALRPSAAHFRPFDTETGTPVLIHGGSVSWNAWRKRWILIGVQQFGTSPLGEICYGEAAEPTGPWKKVRKVVSHDKYSFYNPAHHPFFDQEGGRIIFFEGTYTAEFSGNTSPTPRYDYNQIMYRLDLADPRLRPVAE